MKTIYFAGGCFWGTEHYIAQLEGVVKTMVGYANGSVAEPSYQQVYTDLTGHVECVKVVYDESVVSLRTLCRMFFRSIDPIAVNRQGEDVGTRYRTGIYWTDEEDRTVVEQIWQEVQDLYAGHACPTVEADPNVVSVETAPRVVSVQAESRTLAVEKLPLQCFYPAEEYHQDYLYKNPEGYCHLSLETLRLAREYSQIVRELRACSREDKKKILPRFFKTGKGEYGEGDMFLGVVVPETRKVALRHRDAAFVVVEALLESEWHECRLCALLILVERFKRTLSKAQIVDFYLKHTSGINNWDLVDLSAPYILGSYLVTESDRSVLHDLSLSSNMWEQRIAVVSTLMLIRHGQFDDIMKLAESFLGTKHDLMQKATGWMLREVGKRDEARLVTFLETYKSLMPRTMLRYSIEKFPPERRACFMK